MVTTRKRRRGIRDDVLLQRADERRIKKHSVAGAHRSLAVAEWIPCQADTGREVVIVFPRDLLAEKVSSCRPWMIPLNGSPVPAMRLPVAGSIWNAFAGSNRDGTKLVNNPPASVGWRKFE